MKTEWHRLAFYRIVFRATNDTGAYAPARLSCCSVAVAPAAAAAAVASPAASAAVTAPVAATAVTAITPVAAVTTPAVAPIVAVAPLPAVLARRTLAGVAALDRRQERLARQLHPALVVDGDHLHLH